MVIKVEFVSIESMCISYSLDLTVQSTFDSAVHLSKLKCPGMFFKERQNADK